jgi:hypothetical protein
MMDNLYYLTRQIEDVEIHAGLPILTENVPLLVQESQGAQQISYVQINTSEHTYVHASTSRASEPLKAPPTALAHRCVRNCACVAFACPRSERRRRLRKSVFSSVDPSGACTGLPIPTLSSTRKSVSYE